MEYPVKILMVGFVTHDVKRFVVEKPENYEFIPGQATEVSIKRPEWINRKQPFTFTSLNSDKVLEFTIKGYSEHNGVTKELHNLKAGDEIIIRDVWGAINYKGQGIFIAGGAGITPFIAILRQLKEENNVKGNKLIFSNKTKKDIILEKELKEMFDEGNLILTLTQESKEGYEDKKINEDFIKKYIDDFNQPFYLCGPKQMVEDLKKILLKLGAKVDSLVFEK